MKIKDITVKKSYFNKVLICLLLFVIIFVFVFAGYLFNSQRRQGIEIAENNNKNILSSINSEFSVINDTTKRSLQHMQSLVETTQLIYQAADTVTLGKAYSEMEKKFQIIPQYQSAVTYNNKTKKFKYFGEGLSADSGIENNITYNGKKFLPYKPYLTKTVISKKQESLVTYYAYEYLDGDIMNGAMVVNLKTDWLDSAINSTNINGINIVLCDDKGNVFYEYNKDIHRGTQFDEKYMKKIADPSTDMFVQRINGNKNFISATKFSDSDYYVICEQPYNALYSSYMNKVIQSILLLIFALIAIGLCASVLMSRYISIPMRKIAEKLTGGSAEDVSDGEILDYITTIIDSNYRSTNLVSEMKLIVDDVKQQNILKALMRKESISESGETVGKIKENFDDSSLTGIEVVFEKSLPLNDIRLVCDNIIGRDIEYKFVTLEYNDFILLIKNNESDDFAKEAADSIREKCKGEFDKIPSIFISKEYKIEKIAELYDELALIKKYELIYGVGCVLDYNTIKENCDNDSYEYPKGEEIKLIKALANKNIEECEAVFDAFLSKIISVKVNDFMMALVRLGCNIQSVYEGIFGQNSDEYGKMSVIVKQINKLKTMNDVCNNFYELFELCCENGNNKEEMININSPFVKKALKYIDEMYYDSSLNLDYMAQKLNISSNYFGRVFRNETEQSFNKYLTEYRLKKSAEMIKGTDISIQEIISKVGFVSESNFYKQFKKHFGVTPTDFRNI